MQPTTKEVPKYKCIKEVRALKIAVMDFDEKGTAKIAFEDQSYPIITVKDYRKKFNGDYNDPGYFVAYEDGYTSWSPTKAFEDGYVKI